jgi:electron transfer flavoprotein alpha subunit
MSIWIYAELKEGRLAPISFELAAKARELGGDLEAVALGPGSTGAAEELGRHGVKKLYASDDVAYQDYLALPATDTLAELVKQHGPEAILFGFTYDSREVAGRLAARLGCGIISNAQDVARAGAGYAASVPYFGGAKLATMQAQNSPAIILLRPKAVEASETGGGAAQLEQIATAPSDAAKRAHITERVVEAGEQVKLEDARVVISGGRGMGGPENFPILEELAAALGGAVGASRAVVDAGWVPYSMQVGQTGKTVRPGLYIAAGISGAMQHTVGMKGSKLIVAINKDPEAPILKMADLGVVGDALKIVPKLTAAIKAKKGG